VTTPLDITRPEDDRYAYRRLRTGLQVSPSATRDVAALCRIVNDMARPTPTGTETSLAGCQPA